MPKAGHATEQKARIADYGIATIESITALTRGVFGKETEINVRHTKNRNHGDDCCKLVVELAR
jgi:hypothetical protein